MTALARHIIRDHVSAGGIIALLTIPLWGYGAGLLFWFSTVLIDIDHWLFFIFRTKCRFWDPFSMMHFYEFVFQRRQSKELLVFDIFHTAEFALLLGVAAFLVWPIFQPVFWGVAFHFCVDVIYLTHLGALNKRCYSFIKFFLHRKKIKSAGLDPDPVFRQAFENLCTRKASSQESQGTSTTS